MSNVVTTQPGKDSIKPEDMLSTIDLSDNKKADAPSNCPKSCNCNFSDIAKLICRFDLPNFSAHIAKFIPKINCVDIKSMLSYDPVNCNCSCVCCDVFRKRADLAADTKTEVPVKKDSASQTDPSSSNSDEEQEYISIQPGSSAIAL
jgi:hypothetical protein